MNIIRLLLIISLLAFRCPQAFAADDDGHDAGYEWAENNGIDARSDCFDDAGEFKNNSQSFTEGCIEYVQEQLPDAEAKSEDLDE